MEFKQAEPEFKKWIESDYNNHNIPSKKAIFKAYEALKCMASIMADWERVTLYGEENEKSNGY